MEQFPVNPKRGGGIVKIEAWENEKGQIVKYGMAYITPLIFSGDHGRVIGYDNTHDFHLKHNLGEISEVNDFSNYQELVDRWRQSTAQETRGFSVR